MFLRLQLQQKQKRRLNQGRRHAFIDRQILIIMLTSIFLFFSTQIPLSLFNILLTPVLNSRLTMTQALQLQSIFSFIASINFSVRDKFLFLNKIFCLDNILCALFNKWIIPTRIF
jgi:hypothetical protein